MKITNTMPVPCRPSLFAIAAASLVCSFGVCGIAVSPVFATAKGALSETILTHGIKYYVAVNGSDKGPGSADRPWATLNHAAEEAAAGDTIVVRGGKYVLSAQVRPRNSGRSGAWITYMGYPGEIAIFDAQAVQRSVAAPVDFISKSFQFGAFQIEGVSYVRVMNLTIINSHAAGFTIRDSSNVDLIENSTNRTHSSGIAVWDTNHEGKTTKHIRIIGNTITRATSWEFSPSSLPRQGWPPQEALSIGGAVDFEVAFNHIYDSDKEGIDIKETSRHGKVHHNLVNNVAWQGIYIDAWFGKIRDIEIFSNVVHDNRGAGIVMSVENGQAIDKVDIHNNIIFNNSGSGFYFSRWGVNGVRRNIRIYKNTFYHNGYGVPAAGQTYFWMTGGLYLYSTSLHDILIENNIFSENRGFQIGYSELFTRDGRSWQSVSRDKEIRITRNLLYGRNDIHSPIVSGGNSPDQVQIFSINGNRAVFSDPLFKDPNEQNFLLRHGSPAKRQRVVFGAYLEDSLPQFWWKGDFPSRLFGSRFYGNR